MKEFKWPAEVHIESLSNKELENMIKDCLSFWDLGIIPEGLFKALIKDERMPGTLFSEGISFIINILTHEVFTRVIDGTLK